MGTPMGGIPHHPQMMPVFPYQQPVMQHFVSGADAESTPSAASKSKEPGLQDGPAAPISLSEVLPPPSNATPTMQPVATFSQMTPNGVVHYALVPVAMPMPDSGSLPAQYGCYGQQFLAPMPAQQVPQEMQHVSQ